MELLTSGRTLMTLGRPGLAQHEALDANENQAAMEPAIGQINGL